MKRVICWFKQHRYTAHEGTWYRDRYGNLFWITYSYRCWRCGRVREAQR